MELQQLIAEKNVESRIRARLSDSYGGMYIQHEPEFALIVQSTSSYGSGVPSQGSGVLAIIDDARIESVAKIAKVAYSLPVLEKVLQQSIRERLNN